LESLKEIRDHLTGDHHLTDLLSSNNVQSTTKHRPEWFF